MRRLAVVVALLVYLPVAAQQKKELTEEEKQFLLERAGKRMLDLKIDDDEYALAMRSVLAEKKKGEPYLLKALDFYGVEVDKAKLIDPSRPGVAGGRFFHLAVYCLPKEKISDTNLERLIRFLAPDKADFGTINVVGGFGPRAKNALPVLRKILDTTKDDGAALAARRAIKQIEGGK